MKVYKIVRMYFNDDVKTKTIKRNLSLKEAQEHCRDKETSSSTCTLKKNIEHTEKFGAWFDGFTDQK
jgi:hypothetical protein|tara:strand:- start:629 stop:829 length:201 start_codon:yes stop_codon:yes gene_type:complete